MERKDILDRIQKYVHPFRVTKGKGFQLKDFDPATRGVWRWTRARWPTSSNAEPSGSPRSRTCSTPEPLVDGCSFPGDGRSSKGKHDQARLSGVNPQGCQVVSFKQPSTEDLDHDFMWRYSRHLPERGRIGIFNRSNHEEVLVVRVHEES